MILPYLLLISGLSISAIAEYYSIMGLIAIFSASSISIAVMGVSLGVAKLVMASWIKQNWTRIPTAMRLYGIVAVSILMLITTLGCFGFLSKSHSDQGLVSGDVISRIAVYDEKIKVAKENIELNRKVLDQMDLAVDQVMARSTSESGATKAVAIRRAQSKERARLQSEIAAEQGIINQLVEQRTPIAAEVRKVEAEVGPIKYIAQFVYGETADQNLLEKAVTWVIILIVVVFDPLAVAMLIAAQMTFQWIREDKKKAEDNSPEVSGDDIVVNPTVIEPQAVTEELTTNTDNLNDTLAENISISESIIDPEVTQTNTTTVTDDKNWLDLHPYLFYPVTLAHPPGIEPVGHQVYKEEVIDLLVPEIQEQIVFPTIEDIEEYTAKIDMLETSNELVVQPVEETINDITDLYIQNEEQQVSNLWTNASIMTNSISEDQYKKASQLKLEKRIADITVLVKSGEMQMSDVPEELIAQVKTRV